MHYIYDDGGRKEAGYKGHAGDCVVRAIAIAAQLPYQEVYDAVFEEARSSRRKKHRGSPRSGVYKNVYVRYLKKLGWKWTHTMTIGSGCKVHLKYREIPEVGRLIVKVSRHVVAVINDVMHDTHDPSRGGTRCVYGYWSKD